jgi:protein-L-isoaspartate(D-aspartate) O-methyltransferase
VQGKREGMSQAVTFPELPPVDRRLFVPDDVWVVKDAKWVQVSRQTEPSEWERLVSSENAITTHLKDGIWPSSSSSSPGAMASMISVLRIEPGMRVLEIGTGTGWNAACMAALGAEVVSVEIDHVIAARARDSLRAAGHDDVVVVTGDGELGAPEHSPFERILSTAAAQRVPYAWVEQCRDDGLIVTPYTGEGYRYGLIALTVSGGVAKGGIAGTAAFMPLRGQGVSPPDVRAIVDCDELRIEVTSSGQRLFYP